MIDDFQHDHEAVATVSTDRVEKPPERGKVFDIQVLDPICALQLLRNRRFPDDLAVKAILEQNSPKTPDFPQDAYGFLIGAVFQGLDRRCGVAAKPNVLGRCPAQRRSPSRMASRIGPFACGTQIKPCFPSAMAPSAARKAIPAFKLCLVVECPQTFSCANRAFRLTGPSLWRNAARISSSVANVGLAPGRAKRGFGEPFDATRGCIFTWGICILLPGGGGGIRIWPLPSSSYGEQVFPFMESFDTAPTHIANRGRSPKLFKAVQLTLSQRFEIFP